MRSRQVCADRAWPCVTRRRGGKSEGEASARHILTHPPRRGEEWKAHLNTVNVVDVAAPQVQLCDEREVGLASCPAAKVDSKDHHAVCEGSARISLLTYWRHQPEHSTPAGPVEGRHDAGSTLESSGGEAHWVVFSLFCFTCGECHWFHLPSLPHMAPA